MAPLPLTPQPQSGLSFNPLPLPQEESQLLLPGMSAPSLTNPPSFKAQLGVPPPELPPLHHPIPRAALASPSFLAANHSPVVGLACAEGSFALLFHPMLTTATLKGGHCGRFTDEGTHLQHPGPGQALKLGQSQACSGHCLYLWRQWSPGPQPQQAVSTEVRPVSDVPGILNLPPTSRSLNLPVASESSQQGCLLHEAFPDFQ